MARSKRIKAEEPEKKEEKEKEKVEEEIEETPERPEKKQEEQSDDEISIDFSWIKKGISKIISEEEMPEEESERGEKKKNKEDDELNIDFSWIKKGISKLTSEKDEEKDEHPKKHQKEEEEDVQIDFKKIKQFFSFDKKHKGPTLGKIVGFMRKHQILLLLLIPLFLSFHFRAQTTYLPLTDQLATDAVYNSLRSQLAGQIDQQYPNLPDRQKQELVAEAFQEMLKTQGPGIEQQIDIVSQQYKSRFQDDKGQTYLLAIDPYTYYRQIRNLLDRGHVGDELRDGQPFNTLFQAPLGSPMYASFHIYFGYFFHKVWSFFNSDVHLMKSFFYIPAIISMLAVIPAFFLARKFGGPVAGFFASVMVAIHPVFLSRTPAGFSDTDAYNVFFPLLIVWCFIATFDQKTFKRKLLLMSLTGFLVGIYSYAWTGWWYIFGFTLGAGSLHLFILGILKLRKGRLHEIQHELYLFCVYVLSSAIFVTLFSGFNTFMNLFTAPLRFIRLKAAISGISIWPNVYTTVAELNPINIRGAINQIGGDLLFYIAILGIILIFFKKNKETKFEIRLTVLLALWFIATLYASTKGVRFVLLLVPAFSLAFGTSIGILYTKISQIISQWIQLDKRIIKSVFLILSLLLFIKPLQSASYTAEHELPSMTDAWWESLTQIKEESSEDAIITSWWDFGHWFKTIAERGVTFDGASQSGHNAHFVGRSLLTPNETETIGILRMLDCGQNLAYETLLEETDQNGVRAVDIIKELQLVDREEAKRILKKENITEEILQYTHCDPPEAYFITSEDMTQKAGVWGHFGSWDFRKAQIWQTAKGVPSTQGISLIEELGFPTEEAQQLYNEVQGLQDETSANTWIAPWPSYGQSSPSGCGVEGETITCGNGLVVNKTSWDAHIIAQGAALVPVSLTYFDGEDIVEKKFSNVSTQVSGILIPTGINSYRSMIAQSAHANSIYTRLFYLEGHGLRHFEKISDRRAVTGVRIVVWKVKWDGGEPRTAFNFTEPVENEIILEETSENSTRAANQS